MKRRERERAPFLLSFAMPWRWWVTAYVGGWVVGFVLLPLGAGWFAVWVCGLVAGGLAELYWRQTRDPSEDARWSPLARLFYRRTPPRESR